eukprot:Mrub_10805.p1 GENE.Mrub_10805~~Mrub_10805.p1  ORF type:complete len:204 (+),score=54.21 Mrub_10805:45-614(+)
MNKAYSASSLDSEGDEKHNNLEFRVERGSVSSGTDSNYRPSVVQRMSVMAPVSFAALDSLRKSLPSLLEYAENLSDEEDESCDEEDDQQALDFAVKRDSCWKQNFKVNADAQLDKVPEEVADSLTEFKQKNSSNSNYLGRVQVPAYKDGTMTMIEPSLMKMLKSNMKSTKDEHAELLRDLFSIGRQSYG